MKKIFCSIALTLALLLSVCAQAGTLSLPAGVTEIGAEAFCGNTEIDTVVLPDGVRSIGSQAFAGSGISSINLPDSITCIAEDAFENTDLETVTANPVSYAGKWALCRGYMDYTLTKGTANLALAAGYTVYGVFVPPATGTYTFRSTGSADTCAVLYDINGSVLLRDDEDGRKGNFILEYFLFRGETVRLGMCYSSAAISGPMRLSISMEANTPEIAVGETSVAVGLGETTMCEFTAPSNGSYTFTSVGSADTRGYLYTESGTQLDYDDNSGEGRNFSLTRDMSAGEKVILGVEYTSEKRQGYIKVKVSKAAVPITLDSDTTQVDIAAGETVCFAYECDDYSYHKLSFTSSDALSVSFLGADGVTVKEPSFTSTASTDDGKTEYLSYIYTTESETIYAYVSFESGSAQGAVDAYGYSVIFGESTDVTGTFEAEYLPGEMRYLDFTAPADGSYSISFISTVDYSFDIYVYGSQVSCSSTDTTATATMSAGDELDIYISNENLTQGGTIACTIKADSGTAKPPEEPAAEPITLGSETIKADIAAGETVCFAYESTGYSYQKFSFTSSRALSVSFKGADGATVKQPSFTDTRSAGNGKTEYSYYIYTTTAEVIYAYVSYESSSAQGTVDACAGNVRMTEETGTTGTYSADYMPGETRCLVFTAPADDTYTVSLSGTVSFSYEPYGYSDSSAVQMSWSNNTIVAAMSAGDELDIYITSKNLTQSGSITATITAKSGAVQPSEGLALGDNSVAIPAGETKTLPFTATATGTYTFCTTGSYDTYGYLYDSEGNTVLTDDDSGSNYNFSFEKLLLKGETVNIGVEFYSSSTAATVTLNVSYAAYSPVLSTGDNSIAIGKGETASCTYTAPVDGDYVFTTIGTLDTYGKLYSGTTLLTSDDDGGENRNFRIAYTLVRGQSVTLKVNYVSSNASSYVNLNVSYTSDTATAYRALLIGQVSFSNDTCLRNGGDVNNMATMLRTVNGGAYSITTKKDLTKSQVQSAISSAFAGATDNDVSLFFYASHGVTNSGYYYGALCTYNGEYILTSEIASWLSAVPGKVIVFIGTCGSGAVIENGEVVEAFDADAFNSEVIRAFAAADPGLVIEDENSGEMRTNKFVVMTAAQGGENSWGTEGQGTEASAFNYFPKWIIDSVSGNPMTGDSDKNSALTLSECYSYVANQAANTPFLSDGVYYYQHPQVYPANSSYVLFTK